MSRAPQVSKRRMAPSAFPCRPSRSACEANRPKVSDERQDKEVREDGVCLPQYRIQYYIVRKDRRHSPPCTAIGGGKKQKTARGGGGVGFRARRPARSP